MNRKNCKSCIFGDSCQNLITCGYYAPIDGFPADDEIELFVDNGRREYANQWEKYVSEED